MTEYSPAKVWTYDYESASIREARAGESLYLNTHFGTRREAWQKLIVELEAGVSLGARARQRAREELERVTNELATDAERLVQAKERFAKWEAESNSADQTQQEKKT